MLEKVTALNLHEVFLRLKADTKIFLEIWLNQHDGKTIAYKDLLSTLGKSKTGLKDLQDPRDLDIAENLEDLRDVADVIQELHEAYFIVLGKENGRGPAVSLTDLAKRRLPDIIKSYHQSSREVFPHVFGA